MARCTRYIEGLSLTIRLYRLPYHISHRIRRFPHHVRRGVGVGAESEARAVMSQGAGQGLHIHPVLQRERCEGVPEIMEPDVPQAVLLQQRLYRLKDVLTASVVILPKAAVPVFRRV